MLHIQSPAYVLEKATGDGPHCWVRATHRGIPDELLALGYGLASPAFVAIWGSKTAGGKARSPLSLLPTLCL